MLNQRKYIVSHAPFWHSGSSLTERHYNIIGAALPAALFGVFQYGAPALAVLSLSISTAIFWELMMNIATRRAKSVGDGSAALIGLIFGMMLPASSPWWLVTTGTFIAIVVGRQIYGGLGGNPFNPVLLSTAILMLSWKDYFDFNEALRNYDLGFSMLYPLASLKHFGVSAVATFSPWDLLVGQQIGGIGATFGLGLVAGGVYLILRGFIRWEVPASFLAGVFVTAWIFNLAGPERFGGPIFHLLTGYTLIGAFFLATEDSSSPVNFVPMLLYGAGGGILTVLIRNIGVWVDGAVLAILMMNIANPLLDKISPKPIGKVV